MKENQRITITKRMLKEALLPIVKSKPIEKVSVSELCLAAGINRATFYRHFESPKDVLLEMQTEFFLEMLTGFNETVRPMEPLLYLEALFTFVEDHVEIARLFLRSTSDVDFLMMFHHLYSTALASNKLMTSLEKFDEERRSLVFAYFAGGAYYFLKQWLLTGMKKTPAELAAIVLEIFNPDLIPLP